MQACGIFQLYDEISGEEAVVAINVDGAHDDFLILGNDIGQVAHHPDVVVANDAQGDRVFRPSAVESRYAY